MLQKFSNKGWLCKTWEGEIAMTTVPGVAPVMWNFTVRDDLVAQVDERARSASVSCSTTPSIAGCRRRASARRAYFVDKVTIQP